MQTWRILRAFAWLRWRVLLNSLERRSSRDVVERLSLAVEQLAPAIAAVLMVPSAVALAGAAAYAGWSLGQGNPSITFAVLRFVLFAVSVLALIGPIILPGTERTNVIRLLLLPIPRGVLYLAQSMSALADPWILLAATVVLALPVGLAAAGSMNGAGVALVAGTVLLGVLVGITQLVTSVVHMVLRDRRRAELFTLVIVVFLPVVGMLPGLLGENGKHADAGVERVDEDGSREWWETVERTAVAALPTELYARAASNAAGSGLPAAIAPVVALGTAGACLHAVALFAFGRLLASPGSVGARRTVSTQAPSRWRIPGISTAASAVARNQLRLAFRTPRGRSTMLSPIVVFGLFAAMTARGGRHLEFLPASMQGGLGLGAFASMISLLSIVPLAMNQFAVDRSGLTMVLLAPLRPGALLLGKAIGNGLIVAIPTAVCMVGAAIFFPSGNLAMWLCVPLTLLSAYLLIAPVAAMLSAIFPRAVDLNSIGSRSNAHGAAGLLGMLGFVAAAAPGMGLALIVTRVGRASLAPVALLAWTAICLAISLALFRVALALFERRRENLGLTAQRPA